MTAHLCCPGPSLVRYSPPADDNDFVLAVNRAAKKLVCDFWVCGDFPCVQANMAAVLWTTACTPALVTYAATAGALQDHKTPWRGAVIEFESFKSFCPQWDVWRSSCETTASWALLYAAFRGATQINCYGVDWKGEKDWDGTYDGNDRGVDRWRYEGGLWRNAIVPWLRSFRGIEVLGLPNE